MDSSLRVAGGTSLLRRNHHAAGMGTVVSHRWRKFSPSVQGSLSWRVHNTCKNWQVANCNIQFLSDIRPRLFGCVWRRTKMRQPKTLTFPDAQCMVYLPTFTNPQFSTLNVGNMGPFHWASGLVTKLWTEFSQPEKFFSRPLRIPFSFPHLVRPCWRWRSLRPGVQARFGPGTTSGLGCPGQEDRIWWTDQWVITITNL